MVRIFKNRRKMIVWTFVITFFTVSFSAFQNCAPAQVASENSSLSADSSPSRGAIRLINPNDSLPIDYRQAPPRTVITETVEIYRMRKANDYLTTSLKTEGLNADYVTEATFIFYKNAGAGLRPIYRCFIPGLGHFISNNAYCEGRGIEGQLAYLAIENNVKKTLRPIYRLRTKTGNHLISYYPEETNVSDGIIGYGPYTSADDKVVIDDGAFRPEPKIIDDSGFHKFEIKIYRMRSGSDYLMTSSESEGTNAGYTSEGVFSFYGNSANDFRPIYRCFAPNVGHFVSTDLNCEGTKSEGILAYLSIKNTNNNLRPVYRILTTAGGHFLSFDASEGKSYGTLNEGALGYAP